MTEQLTKKRYGSLAALMSFVSPGLGHLYAGHWKWAIAIPFIMILFLGTIGWTKLIFTSNGILVFASFSLLLYLTIVVSSFFAARKVKSQTLNKSQRWYVYLLFFMAVSVMNSIVMDYRGALFGFEPFRIPSEAMMPALIANDFIVVDAWAYDEKEPEIGDVVVFDYPRDREIKYIKRLIGKGGDHIAVYDKKLYVNGKPLKRNYIGRYNQYNSQHVMDAYDEELVNGSNQILLMPSRPALDAEYIVPEDHYFMMGDNRDNSNDSRYWGVVPRDHLYGKAEYTWLSLDAYFNFRDERIGKRL